MKSSDAEACTAAPTWGSRLKLLHAQGIRVTTGVLAGEAARMNEAFNHWIVHHTPFVTVKAAMTLDGKIATAGGESKWITGERARAHGQKLRQGTDAILVGSGTVLNDDPSLTVRGRKNLKSQISNLRLRRLVLDTRNATKNVTAGREKIFKA